MRYPRTGSLESLRARSRLIASIDKGLGLFGPSSGTKCVVTGPVLLAAVTVDSFARRRQERAGKA